MARRAAFTAAIFTRMSYDSQKSRRRPQVTTMDADITEIEDVVRAEFRAQHPELGA